MKKILLLSGLVCTALAIQAQVTFSTSTGTYSNLVGATLLSDSVIWDDPSSDLKSGTYNVGFSVKGASINNQEITIGDGFIYFEDATGDNGLYFETTGLDLIDRGFLDDEKAVSPISAQVTGNSGSRVFKIEWKNFGFYREFTDSGTVNDYGNIQLWIHESDGRIEYRYGEIVMNAEASFDGNGGYNVFAGVLNFNNFNFDGISLVGQTDNPDTKDKWGGLMVGFPAKGRIYTFKFSSGASINNSTALKVKLYPQPAVNYIKVELPTAESAQYSLYTIKGELLSSGQLNGNQELDIANLKNGMYAIRIVQNGQQYHSVFHKN
jgi:hypothetical protein